MSRLPTPGGDYNNWGTILNDFLEVAHNPDGTLKVSLTNASKLQGVNISTTAPSDGQLLAFNDSSEQWEPLTPDSGVALGSANPQPIGTAAAGASASSAHEDHIHPSTGVGMLAATNTWTSVNTYQGDSIFRSGRPWVDVRAYGTDTAAIDTAFAAAQSANAALYFSPGNYTYSGTGLDSISGGTIVCIGAGRHLVNITIGAGIYLFKPSGFLSGTFISGLNTTGGAGLIKHTYAGINVANLHDIRDCRFKDYTKCAIASLADDMPYWHITSCIFDAVDDDAAIGIALPRDTSGSFIKDNSFFRNRIDVKLQGAGLSTYIQNNDFIHFNGSPSVPRARIWFVPTAGFVNAGTGAVVRDNKFGNENLDPADYNILYADEGAGADLTVRMPVLNADSTGYIQGHNYSGNKASGAGSSGNPFVYSTTPNVRSCNIGPNIFDGTPPSYLLEFRTPPGPDRTTASNILGPVISFPIGIEVAARPASNAAWLGMPNDPSGQLDTYAGAGFHRLPGGADTAGYTNLLTTGIRSFSNGFGLTLTDVTDSQGGADATEVTFVTGAFIWGYVASVPTSNRPTFLEFDLKAGSSSPLVSVEAGFGYDSNGPIHERRFPVPPAWGWARYRIPFKMATVAANTHVFFRGPANGTIQIGRVRLYHANEPLNVDGVIPNGLELSEMPSDLAAPPGSKARLYVRDNGSGKTQLVVRFPTGAVQVIATEP